jgi:multidrug efflux pump subunit AcrB
MADLLYRNRRLLVLVLLLVVAAGAHALLVLPRQEDPTLTTRFALILTPLPGGSAERVEALVTEPIERELREMAEVKQLISTSRAGVSTVSVELRDDIDDVDPVWSRVRDRLSDLEAVFPAGTFPPDLKDREHIDTYTLIAALRWRSANEPNYAVLRRLGEDLRDALRDVSGTSFVKVFGAPKEEIRVDLDRHASARLGLSPEDIARSIRGSDAKVTAGTVRSLHGDLQIEVSGELDSLERIRNLTIGVGPEGQTLRLRDVAAIEKATEDPPSELALFDDLPGVAVGARMQTAERTDLWSARARGVVEAYAATLPSTLELDVIFDQSRYVEERLGGLLRNLLFGVALVLGVTLLLMGWRSAVVVGATLPLASLMVFAGLRLLDVPIQQMSVMGLIIALGMLIDNAIIMTDEVGHDLRAGIPPRDAIRQGVKHLTVPLLGSTLTTVLAFMPMILVAGPTGEFIRSIGISVVLAIVSSLLLALSVVPALVALLGAGSNARGPGWLRGGLAPGFLARPYRGALSLMLRHPLLAMLFAAFLPLTGFFMASRLDEQFFPPAERDQLRVVVELPPQASIEQTRRLVREVGATLREDPDVRHVHWLVGRNAPKFYYNMMAGREGSANFAEALVQLRSTTQALDGIRAMQERVDERFPEALVLVKSLEQGPPFDAPIEMRILGPDLAVLRRLGDEARTILAGVDEVIHTKMSIGGSRPQVAVELDEASLRRTGLGNTDVAAQLMASFEGAQGGTLLEATEELPVRVRLARSQRGDVDALASVDLFTHPDATGRRRSVPLSAVGEPSLQPEEGGITRLDGRRYNAVQGVLTAGTLPAVVLRDFQAALAVSGFAVPPGYRVTYGGEQEERDDAVQKLLASVALLVVAMVSVLVLSFGSFRLAALILAIGGLSIGLGLLPLWVFDQNFGFMAIVGIMGLVGLAINDSIAVLAGLRSDEAARAGDVGATEQVVFRSTRHVLSTTVTTVAGFLPLILAGGQLWPPLALSIAGGVAGATVLALFFLPAAHRRLVARPGRA